MALATHDFQIYLLDKNFSVLSLVDVFNSLKYTKRWNGVGDFTLLASSQEPYTVNFDPVHAGWMYLRVDIDGAPDFCGRVLRPQFDSGDGEYGTWTVTGNDLNGFLDVRRIVPAGVVPPNAMTATGYNFQSGAAEGVLKAYVSQALSPGIAPDSWGVPGYSVAPGTTRGSLISYNGLWDNLLTVCQKLAWAGDIDFDTTLQVTSTGTGMLFQTYWPIRGIDHTVGNAGNAAVVQLTPDNSALGKYTYVGDSSGLKNTLIVGGLSFGANFTQRSYTEMTNAASRSKWGVSVDFIDARNAASQEAVTTFGQATLNEVGDTVQTLEVDVLDTGPYTYKTNWDIGDLITVSVPVGGSSVTLNKQITQIDVTLEGGKLIAPKPTLGLPPANLITRLKGIARKVGLIETNT